MSILVSIKKYLISGVLHTMPSTIKPVWTGNTDNTAFIFYQGRDSSQVHAAKYLGNNKMGTTTGEVADFRGKGILTIPPEKLWVYPEIREIDRHVKFGLLSRFKHWVQGMQVVRPEENGEQLDYTPLYPQNQSGSVHRYSVSNSRRSLGQKTDIKSHKKRYDSLSQHHPEINNVVVYGVSRGAATTFASVAENNYKNVKLCVLEAPPASIRDLFKVYFSKLLGKILYNESIAALFLGKHHKTGKQHQALGHVANFPNDIPLVIISSQKDTTVHHKNSLKLALAVAAKRIDAQSRGEAIAPVYFLQLDKSDHNDYCINGSSEDPERYQNFMHAIYKKQGLPYVEEYAIQGEQTLKTAVLTDGLLKEQIKFQSEFKNDKPARKTIRNQALESIRTEINTLDTADKARVVNICAAMPLYCKHRNRHTLFGKTDTLKKLETLIEEHHTSGFNHPMI